MQVADQHFVFDCLVLASLRSYMEIYIVILGTEVVKALCYKLEGRWFDPR